MEQVFIDNPSLDVAYKTCDGKYFFLENDARNHARTLEDKKVIEVVRMATINEADEQGNELKDMQDNATQEQEDLQKNQLKESTDNASVKKEEKEVISTTPSEKPKRKKKTKKTE